MGNYELRIGNYELGMGLDILTVLAVVIPCVSRLDINLT
jgi:hypothetical protein